MLNFVSTAFISPLEQFEVVPLISLSVPLAGSLHISLTNLALYAFATTAFVVGIHVLSTQHVLLVPTRWSVGIEAAYASLHSMVKEQIGSANELYFPAIYGCFLYILVSNLLGNIPYSYAIGTSGVFALGLSLTIWLGCTILGLYRHGFHFFSYFVPAGTPIGMVPLLAWVELISYIARAFSLGIRLFANLVAGHTLLKILSGFIFPMFAMGPIVWIIAIIPMGLFTALIGLEVAVSFIQAYVFTILTCIYIKDALDLH